MRMRCVKPGIRVVVEGNLCLQLLTHRQNKSLCGGDWEQLESEDRQRQGLRGAETPLFAGLSHSCYSWRE